MSWWEGLICAISLALAIGTFVVSDDEPFVMRVAISAGVGLLWLPGLILFCVMLVTDGIVAFMRWVRP